LNIELGTIAEEQYRAWWDALHTAFGEDYAEDDVERFRRGMELERILAAFDGEAIVGTAAAFSFSVTVPGGRRLPAAGVTAVGVLPTHRRQGILRRMMARQLADARARGEPLAVLWASEGVIYQRFGYGLATVQASFEIERRNAAFRQPHDPSGRIRLVGVEDAARAFPGIYDAVSLGVPGFIARDELRWRDLTLADPRHARRGYGRKYFLLHERDGRPTGYAIYRIKEEWNDHGPRNELQVIEAMAVDAAAGRDVWRYLFNVDLVHLVTRGRAPLDDPLLLQLERPETLAMKVRAGIWLRILDVPSALAGRGYGSDGELVIDVADQFMPELAGRWRLRVTDGRATVEPDDGAAQLELGTNELAAVYLGAFGFADLARAGRLREAVPGSVAAADRLFASAPRPWCPQPF
jgi:predicted acetyltransferase